MFLRIFLVNGISPFQFVLLTCIGIGFLFTPGMTLAEDKVTGHLIVEDILARPGTSVMLKAALIEKGLLGNKGLGGETIIFTVQGQPCRYGPHRWRWPSFFGI